MSRKEPIKIYVDRILEIYSKSKKCWVAGKVTEIKGKLFSVSGSGFNKRIPINSKHYRLPRAKPHIRQSTTTLVAGAATITVSRKTKHTAKPQSSSISDLPIGSIVEVYSKSMRKWVRCKLGHVEGQAADVFYGSEGKQRRVLISSCRPFISKTKKWRYRNVDIFLRSVIIWRGCVASALRWRTCAASELSWLYLGHEVGVWGSLSPQSISPTKLRLRVPATFDF